MEEKNMHALPANRYALAKKAVQESNGVVVFDEQNIKNYLDNVIVFWRRRRDEKEDEIAKYYIDAFQSVRNSLFGELLS